MMTGPSHRLAASRIGQNVERVSDPAVQGQAWNCSYNVLKAHAAAVKVFRAAVPTGRISMCLNSEWAQPLTNSTADAVSSSL